MTADKHERLVGFAQTQLAMEEPQIVAIRHAGTGYAITKIETSEIMPGLFWVEFRSGGYAWLDLALLEGVTHQALD